MLVFLLIKSVLCWCNVFVCQCFLCAINLKALFCAREKFVQVFCAFVLRNEVEEHLTQERIKNRKILLSSSRVSKKNAENVLKERKTREIKRINRTPSNISITSSHH